MKDLLEFLEKASCNLSECPSIEMDCNECITKMIKEHNEKVKEDAITEITKTLAEREEGYKRAVIMPLQKAEESQDAKKEEYLKGFREGMQYVLDDNILWKAYRETLISEIKKKYNIGEDDEV